MTVSTVRLLWLCIGLIPALAAGAETPVPVVVHEDHFLRNDSGLKQPAHFLVLGDTTRFEAVFGTVPPLMNQKKRTPVPPDAFETQLVVAAIHQGREYTDYHDVKATREGTTLTLSYRTAVRATPQTSYACPLIVTVPRQPALTRVVFVENGKPVAEAAVEPPAQAEAPPAAGPKPLP